VLTYNYLFSPGWIAAVIRISVFGSVFFASGAGLTTVQAIVGAINSWPDSFKSKSDGISY